MQAELVLSNGAETAIANRAAAIRRAERKRKTVIAPAVMEVIARSAAISSSLTLLDALAPVKTCPTCGHILDDDEDDSV